MFFFFSQFCILLIQCLVFLIIDRIIRFHTFLPGNRIFSGNNRLWLGTEFKVLVLNDAGVRSLAVRVVYYSNALVVFLIQNLRLKTQAAVFQLAKLILIISINGSCIHDLFP